MTEARQARARVAAEEFLRCHPTPDAKWFQNDVLLPALIDLIAAALDAERAQVWEEAAKLCESMPLSTVKNLAVAMRYIRDQAARRHDVSSL